MIKTTIAQRNKYYWKIPMTYNLLSQDISQETRSLWKLRYKTEKTKYCKFFKMMDESMCVDKQDLWFPFENS